MKNSDNLAKIAINKSLLKEFNNNENDRIVYLNDGDEFQIQLFNPFQYVIGVSIAFNDDYIDDSKLLVIRPGERIWLDRYLNDNKKFKFSTYQVNNSADVQQAIANNGAVTITFYKERKKENKIWVYNPDKWNNDVWTDCSVSSSFMTYFSNSNFSNPITSSCYDTATYTASSSISSNAHTNTSGLLNNKIETGRVEKGSNSKQKFYNYDGDFESFFFKMETIKLLPQSRKQITSDDLKKKYCYNCGKKIKPEFKFCPNCGAKQ